MIEPNDRNDRAAARRRGLTALLCSGTVALMIAGSFAAVPLYRLFCQVTGFGGTTQRAAAAPDRTLERQVTVRFDSATAPGLPWQFHPLQGPMPVKVGEVELAHYRATNRSDEPVAGHATYNVTPDRAGRYFMKVQCFCFEDQTLQPGQSVDMPVQFYVDPAIAADRGLDDVRTITLSYTFFPAAKPAGAGQVSRTERSPSDVDG